MHDKRSKRYAVFIQFAIRFESSCESFTGCRILCLHDMYETPKHAVIEPQQWVVESLGTFAGTLGYFDGSGVVATHITRESDAVEEERALRRLRKSITKISRPIKRRDGFW